MSLNPVHTCEPALTWPAHLPWLPSEIPHPQESEYARMTENSSLSAVTQHFEPQTSDEKVWRSPGYHVVETALEVTAYALTDRRPPEPPPAA
ncbi:hypothetical protein GCM10010339_41880 [Streptomyces alanosinicus]|uniref:Coenzyme PQQ synthesis protein A n=2 Tax=Streptomyces alanosinicus TaxID=68171 RepID=A0A918YJS0_9ACTN|nr:hypothetical protein GCM10010339_41880 [Streptomyces alanosinicus]